MAVHPLRPATDRRLGRPLPHQPANRTQAHPPAIACKQRPSFKSVPCGTDFVSGISTPFGVLSPAGGQVAYALLTRSPLGFCRNKIPVRLACVRHAASVHHEPGSNSQKISYLNNPFGLLKPYFSIAYSALKRIFYFSLFLLRPFCKEPIFGALLPYRKQLTFRSVLFNFQGTSPGLS